MRGGILFMNRSNHSRQSSYGNGTVRVQNVDPSVGFEAHFATDNGAQRRQSRPRAGRIDYVQLDEETLQARVIPLSSSTVRLHSTIKALAQCQIFLGLVALTIGSLADYMSGRQNTIRVLGLPESCAFYFILTGVVGVCGSASYRRGLLIAFLVMCIHAALIFVPAMVITSTLDIHMYQQDCYWKCDWPLFSRHPSECQIRCRGKEHQADTIPDMMTRIGTDFRIDAILIATALLEFFLAVSTTVLCFRRVCETWGVVDDMIMRQIVRATPQPTGNETTSTTTTDIVMSLNVSSNNGPSTSSSNNRGGWASEETEKMIPDPTPEIP